MKVREKSSETKLFHKTTSAIDFLPVG